jgi:hypothetical protein
MRLPLVLGLLVVVVLFGDGLLLALVGLPRRRPFWLRRDSRLDSCSRRPPSLLRQLVCIRRYAAGVGHVDGADPRPDVAAQIRGADIGQAMEGEHDIETSSHEQAVFWCDIYREILALDPARMGLGKTS